MSAWESVDFEIFEEEIAEFQSYWEGIDETADYARKNRNLTLLFAASAVLALAAAERTSQLEPTSRIPLPYSEDIELFAYGGSIAFVALGLTTAVLSIVERKKVKKAEREYDWGN